METDFHARLDRAILAGRSSQSIASEFGIRSETVRKRRSYIRRGVVTPFIEADKCSNQSSINSR